MTSDGRIEIYTSGADAGQGHADTIPHLGRARVGRGSNRVDVIEGDTTRCPEGSGTFISAVPSASPPASSPPYVMP